VEVAVEILIGLIALAGIIGLIFKWGRDNARREQQALHSLRVLIEDKQKEIDGRKAS
jgi:hypothetical protein